MLKFRKLKLGLVVGLILLGLVFVGIVVGIKIINANQEQRQICIRDTSVARCTYSPYVRYDTGLDRYIMLYGSMTNDVGDHTYRDRIYYAEHFGNGIGEEGWMIKQPILMPEVDSRPGESGLIHDPAVILVNGVWHVYYTGAEPCNDYDVMCVGNIFHASGPDLFHLEKRGMIGGIKPADYAYGKGEPSILYEDRIFKLFYFDSMGEFGASTYLAESADGHNFTYIGGVSPDITLQPSVSKHGDEYILVFSGGGGTSDYKIYIARTKDLPFPAAQPIFTTRPGEWDSTQMGHAYYIDERIYYDATNREERALDLEIGVYLIEDANRCVSDQLCVIADFEDGVDWRMTVYTPPGYSGDNSEIQYAWTDPPDGNSSIRDDINYWTMYDDGDGVNKYTDVKLNLVSEDWSNCDKLKLKWYGVTTTGVNPKVELFAYNAKENSYWRIGEASANSNQTIESVFDISDKSRDQITRILFRVKENYFSDLSTISNMQRTALFSVSLEGLSADADCNPNNTDSTGNCNISCGASQGCNSKTPNSCSSNPLKKCDSNCQEVSSYKDGMCNCGENSENCPKDCKEEKLSADLNCDGSVNLADAAILLSFWNKDPSGATSCQSPDINQDGNVNLADFAIIMSQWTTL
jgi:hypothetical protein